jgi:hypothetical protein
MRRYFLWIVLGGLLSLTSQAYDGYARLTAVDPESGKVGDVASAKGENLGKSNIADIYLTDGKNDFKAVIMEQSGEEIKFKVPKAQAGRYHLMILTAKKDSMIEQPVVFTVEE